MFASDPDALQPSMSAALVPRARPHWLVNDAVLLAVAVVGGVAHAVLLLGWPVINPLNLEWLKGDPAAHYLGWAFYRHERHWGFPLTWTTRLGYPVGVSIAFQDSIPLIAIPLRGLSPILPEPFQYLGLYAALALVLQMYFALLLCRRLCNAHPLFTYGGGLLILLAPVLTRRLHGHFALASHWLILASLWACLRVAPTTSIARGFWPFFALLVAAGAIHPYLAAQCLLIALAAAARMILLDRSRWRPVVGVSILLMAALAASLTVCGFLGTLEWSAYRSEGFGLFSLNLLAPFNPTGLALLLPELPVAHHFQRFEGYGYLGAGIIAMLLVTLAVHRRRALALFGRADVPLVLLAIVCTLAAASSTLTLGPYTIASVRLPRFLDLLGATFRASGRLFWPAYYLIMVGTLVAVFRLWRSPAREILLVAALVLQVADIPPLHAHIRNHHAASSDSPLRSPRWRELGRDHARLLVIPPWICPGSPGGEDSYRIFGQLVAAQRMETNTYYPARAGTRATREHCTSIPHLVMAGLLDLRAAYVVTDGVLAALRARDVGTHRCETVDGFNLCTRVAGAPARHLDLPVYRPGTTIDFAASGQATPYQLYGWSLPEASGAWTEGPEAGLALMLAPHPTGPLELVAVVTPFLAKRHRRLQVDVMVNDRQVAAWRFTRGSRAVTERILLDGITGDGATPLVLRFRISKPRSPSSLRLSDDHRELGLFFQSLSIAPARLG